MPNLLASEPSAYLKSAAHQPVHWHPWGEAAFARARAEDKPILLDIGAVWCHWCHVMDGESYEDPKIAETLNRDFVCIKVDRDERPDVDARYQRAVQALTGQGGWPLTAFLTAEGEVFFGGTYFPPEENHYGRPGFLSVLTQVAGIYRGQRDKVAENATAIRRQVSESLDEAKSGEVSPATLERAASEMARLFDIRYGGFGRSCRTSRRCPTTTPSCCTPISTATRPWARRSLEKSLRASSRGCWQFYRTRRRAPSTRRRTRTCSSATMAIIGPGRSTNCGRRCPIRRSTLHVARSMWRKPARCTTTHARTCCGGSMIRQVTTSGRLSGRRSGGSRRPATSARHRMSTPRRTSIGTP
ncbi:MAG: hypothetical protein DMD56_02905 [Gemmatimonadetes bacterium]|nr:MAG: hypothetical protein DMD56_02905 [Gemmatimonadota bacterium]